MDFGLTDEQDQLAAAERSWLSRNDPLVRVRATLDDAAVTVDPAAVSHAAESGLLTLLTPKMGGTYVDLAVVTEAHGYAGSSLPVADLAVAAWLLDRADVPSDDGLVGLAFGPAAEGDDVLRLTGRTTPVPMARDLDRVAVVGHAGDREYLALFTEPTWSDMTTFDLTRSWARLTVDAAVDEWSELPAGTVAGLRDALAVHRAIDALGAAARLLETTVSYAGQREQFGAPIGSFQAVKHHCADMVVAVEASRASLWAAALALDTALSLGTATGSGPSHVASPAPARTRAASAAAAFAKSAAARVAGDALQVHGGIGFTWEHDLHLFLRRIKVDEAVDGTVAEHRAALVTA